MYLHFDYETASEAELTEVGLHNYMIHPTTRILMMAYAFGDQDVKIWFPHVEPLPQEVRDAFHNPDIDLVSFNSPFERLGTDHLLGIKIPAERFQDPQASARYLSLPANLDKVGQVLGLPLELQKDKRGQDLMKIFSFPQIRGVRELKKNPELPPVYFNNHITHPVEFLQYAEYCKQDVRAEREIVRREKLLGAFPLPPRERRIWLLDQKINDRGMPTDRRFVQNLFALADRNKEEKLKEQNERTGLDNANAPAQLLPWVQDRGYPLSNLRKQNIEKVLKQDSEMTDECKQVLKARLEAGSTSYKKLATILRVISPDNRIRHMFTYMGSARCGRWSGNTVQPHNFARPDGTFEDLDNVKIARELIYKADYEKLSKTFEIKK